jgi:hypothetical protein
MGGLLVTTGRPYRFEWECVLPVATRLADCRKSLNRKEVKT